MSTFRSTVTGLDRMRTRLQALQADLRAAGALALADTATETLLVSQELVPVKDGGLQASGTVSEVVELADGTLSVAVSYGGGDIDYAIRQHEDQDLVHSRGQAKYLEIPVYGIGPGALERGLSIEMKKVLK